MGQQDNTLGTILLVEDHVALMRNMAFLLQIAGFDVVMATDGEQALHMLNDFMPDAIISDTVMPNMDGLTLLNHVRNSVRWRNIPFILATAQYEYTDLMQGLSLGADDYVPKPFDIYDILDSLQRCIPSLTDSQQLAV